MAAFVNQIVGLVRFSYPALNGFDQGSEDVALNRDRLFDRSRLEARFRLFEGLTLPSLLAQADGPGFSTVFLIGEGMPSWAEDRLRAGVAALKGGIVISLPPMQHYPATRTALAAAEAPTSATHRTSFRLDDDDALDRRHIARMARMCEVLHRLAGPRGSFVTGSNRGLFLEIGADGNRIIEVVEKLPLGIGLALTAPLGSSENIFRRNHRFLPQFYSTYTDATVPAFIRTVHAGNDSSAYASGQSRPLEPDEAQKLLSGHFVQGLSDLMAL